MNIVTCGHFAFVNEFKFGDRNAKSIGNNL